METIFRQNRTAIKISGPEAKKLLNDVVTGIVSDTSNAANWWALLSPQGKIQAEGLIGWHDGGFYLDIDREVKTQFLRKMNMFKLRAQASIDDLDETHMVGWRSTANANSNNIAHKDGRNKYLGSSSAGSNGNSNGSSLGMRVIAEKSTTDSWQKNSTEFTARRVNLGICQLGEDFATDKLFPHDIGMDLLGGVDFTKGCYVGQEVVSRMRHKAKTRKRPVIVSFNGDENHNIKSGEEILLNGKTIGFVGNIINSKAIGIVRLDRIDAGEIKAATIAGQSITLAVPVWASYDFVRDSSSNP